MSCPICFTTIIVGLFLLYFLAALYLHVFSYGIYQGTKSMVGKTVFITGGTSGIGKESVIDLYLRGFKVFFTGRNAKAAHNVVDTIIEKLKNCNF